MNFRVFITACLLLISVTASGQSDPIINQTDRPGKEAGILDKKISE